MESHLENNKYYVPEISEFHVGFECEILGIIGAKEDERLFSQSTIITKKELDLIHLLEIRVKYLDKSDIESLGWMLSHQYNGAWWEIGKLIPDAEEMWHPLGNWKYRLSLGENNRVHIDGRNPGNGGQTSRFNGTIKNKSQLKFIMTCLGILE